MPAGLALLGAEGGSEAIDATEAHRGRFEVELAGLGQVQRAAEVVHLEERGLVFADDGGEDGGVDEGEAVIVEEAADRIDDGVTDLADAPLALGAEMQVAVAHEEIDAVGLGRDGIALGGRDDPGVGYGQFVASDTAGVGADDSGDAQRGFLAQVLEAVEQLFGDVGLFDDALAEAGAVAEDDELNLAAGAAVVDPAVEGDFLADVVLQLIDVYVVCVAHGLLLAPVDGRPTPVPLPARVVEKTIQRERRREKGALKISRPLWCCREHCSL